MSLKLIFLNNTIIFYTVTKLQRNEVYNALSHVEWKTGNEIADEMCSARGLPDRYDGPGFFRIVHHEWVRTRIRVKTYCYLVNLVEEELAVDWKRPLTEDEVAQYDRIGIPANDILREGRYVYRKAPTERKIHQEEGCLERLLVPV